MKVVIANQTHHGNRSCKRYEVRAYQSWTDVKRAETQLRRAGNRTVSFLEVNGPALQITRYVQDDAR